ncbi:hypothetical protein HYS95_03480, partial [Candidatus Daviesbacteria bacterium]|nr:hypothetical protein [Candidatus Daviesbacteria bacterium]
MMCRLAILISNKGTGTNLQAIIDGAKNKKINAKIAAVISDTPASLGLQRAKKYNLPIKIVSKKEQLLRILKKLNLDYVCLAGWKQIVLDEVIDAFPDRILNLHPGLIPDQFDGEVKNPDGSKGLWNRGKLTDLAIGNFIDTKATYAGSSIHFLTHQFDFGPVLGRAFEKVKKGDTIESLYSRLKVKENKLYAEVLVKLSTQKTVLVIDGGGRGAALVDKYGKSEKVKRILAVPGNDMMQINTKKPVTTFPNLKTTSVKEIIEICQKEKVDLVDVAQDNAVASGLVNELRKLKIQTFGPTKEAGQVEWDKAWARDFMKKYNIPHPQYHVFSTEKEGIDFVKNESTHDLTVGVSSRLRTSSDNGKPATLQSGFSSDKPTTTWFVKAAGLAEGKGVIPAANAAETVEAIKSLKNFGDSGKTYLLEQALAGEEFSAFAICDGVNFKITGFAQDHKRVNDGDKGPNTGGMGCVSNPLIILNIKNQILNILKKAVEGLTKEKRPYKGVLYLGGIVVGKKVFVIEFNARWGDPEAEVVIPSIQNDFVDLADIVINQKLNTFKIKVDKKVRVAVALTAKGYPVDYSKVKGKKILGLDKALKTGIKIYGAGIKRVNEAFVVNGGRVLFLVGEGNNVKEARDKAYKAIGLISIEGNNLHYRKDIGWR